MRDAPLLTTTTKSRREKNRIIVNVSRLNVFALILFACSVVNLLCALKRSNIDTIRREGDNVVVIIVVVVVVVVVVRVREAGRRRTAWSGRTKKEIKRKSVRTEKDERGERAGVTSRRNETKKFEKGGRKNSSYCRRRKEVEENDIRRALRKNY